MPASLFQHLGLAPTIGVFVFEKEDEMLNAFGEVVCKIDPDVLAGFETQKASWGYLELRFSALKELTSSTFAKAAGPVQAAPHLPEGVLRCRETWSRNKNSPKSFRGHVLTTWVESNGAGVCVPGRLLLNLWRIFRSELKFTSYTLESCAFSICGERVSHFSPHDQGVFLVGSPTQRSAVLQNLLKRTRLNLDMMQHIDLINRCSEMARIFGQTLVSVLVRGSQYRVESMLLRLARSQLYRLRSITDMELKSMPVIESIPLVMEPHSGYYTNPVLVLDFRSLYPSIIMAFNICYSTCLGYPADQKRKSGITHCHFDSEELQKLKCNEDYLIAPNGLAFLTPKRRKGILPRLLFEILQTRVAVKDSMKRFKDDIELVALLNSRQNALKLLANVTYGYTSAGYSGRMPNSSIADAIVEWARFVIEWAIRQVNEKQDWGANVCYGDTDSLFVELKGRTRDQAFAVGAQIAQEITAHLPNPIKLQFEKVYHPLILMTKKRYVGFSYESSSQTTPKFDAKGVETVRRDQCPLVSQIMEQSLRLLFTTHDLSQVRHYMGMQASLMTRGSLPLHSFVFNKEVKLGGYRGPTLPPAATVAHRAMLRDPRSAPLYGQRQPFLVVNQVSARLVDSVVSPEEYCRGCDVLLINYAYYKKQICAVLARAMNIVGVDVSSWLDEV